MWKEYKIKELGKVITGNTPSSKSPGDFGFVMPFVTPSDYKYYNKWIAFAERNLSTQGIRNLQSRTLPEKSILVTCIGSDMGKVAMNKLHVISNQQINSIIPNENVDAEFLYYKLVDSYETLRMYGEAGTAVPIVNKTDFENIVIEIPERKNEQKRIAEILSSLDDKIDLLHRQNKTLEALAETLFRQWFVEETEEGWETLKVSDVATINGKTISKSFRFDEIEYLDTGSITKGMIEGFQHYKLTEAPSRAQRIVQNNDIVYSLVRPIQRHYGLLNNVKPNTIVSTGFSVITCNDFSPHFLYLLLTSDDAVDYFDMVAEGSTSTYPSLKPSDIADFKFQKPPMDKLKDFENYASNAWKKIHVNTKQIKTLTQLRDALLPKLMSGEVRAKI